MHCDGVVNKELDPDSCETDRSGVSCPVGRRLLREEELRTVNRKSSDDVSTASQTPKNGCAECGIVELDSGVPVTNGQHWRDLRRHYHGLGNHGSPVVRAEVASMLRKQPMMAGEILHSVLPLAIHGVMQILDNPGARGFHFLKMGIHILEKHS
jgi:Fe-S oxidoreductase